MPEHLRALIVIVALAGAAFIAFEKAYLSFENLADFKRLRNLWFASTLAAFLCHDFWVYALVECFLILISSAYLENKTASFFLLLFVVPAGGVQVPGLGLINYLFELNQPRLLSLLLLIPCVLSANKTPGTTGRISDNLFLSYILLTVVLQLRQTTFTDTMRFGFHTFLDAVLPYYAFSRSLKDIQTFRKTLLCFVLTGTVISFIALFEFAKHWLLYGALIDVLGLGAGAEYLGRANMLRAAGPTSHSIVLGYVMMVAIGLHLFLRNAIEGQMRRRFGLAFLAGGLIASLSRGPWLGAMMLIGIFFATGNRPMRNLLGLGFVGMLGLASLFIVPGGEKLLNLLPFIGTTDIGNIEYRSRLFSNALIVIKRNFWFGSVDYLQTPEMQEMTQGQGLIDIVNSYIGIALSVGVIGLTLFVAFYASTILGARRAMKSIRAQNSDEYVLGRSLVATAIAVLFTIATVSSIVNVPIIYWSLAGMLVAYTRMIRRSIPAVSDLRNGR